MSGRLIAACTMLLLVGACALAHAQPTTAPASPSPSGFSLTVYSTADPATFDPQDLARQQRSNPYYVQPVQLPGYGVVREIRPIDLKAGQNTVRFTDVASGIDPTTVSFQSLTDGSAAVLEQNYEYDVVSAAKLLEKYLGREIQLQRKSADVQQPANTLQGTLLSSDAQNLVIQNNDAVQVIPRDQVAAIRLADDRGLITKPTLVWTVQTAQAGQHQVRVTYQTDGLTWRADYNLLINQKETAADLGAWVTLLNQSGASYPNTHLKLVAGDVHRIERPQRDYFIKAALAGPQAPPAFQEKAFFEYHLYTLSRTTTLPDNSTKQIELFPTRPNIPVSKTYVYYGLAPQWRTWTSPQPNWDRNLGTESNTKVDIYLALQNSQANGLGIPLPAGRIRVYKQDPDDALNEFIGEDVIQHTPRDEKVLVRMGSAFDVVGQRKQTSFTVDTNNHVMTESFQIIVRNHKSEPVNVIIKENLFRWANWEITAASDKWDKQDYRTIHIPVTVPADGSKTVTYSVRYTW